LGCRDINWRCQGGWSALDQACSSGRAEVVSLILRHPHVDVNLRNPGRNSPLINATWMGREEIVRLLLDDDRVQADLTSVQGKTALWVAALWGYHDIVRWLIASGKDLNVPSRAYWVDGRYTAAEIARYKHHLDTSMLIEQYCDSTTNARFLVRLSLGLFMPLAAELFALIIFLCDDYLKLRVSESTSRRFFGMATRLPMELQMVLCLRMFRSAKTNIVIREAERAFRLLVAFLEQ